MTKATRPIIGLGAAMLLIALLGLIFTVILQGRKIADLEAKLLAHEAQFRRIERQNVQSLNVVNQGFQHYQKRMMGLERDVAALKPGKVTDQATP